MAKIESSYININRLSPGGKPARGLRSYDGSKINKHRRAYINDGVRNVIVYDELRATFITPDDKINIGANGGSLVKPENYDPDKPNEESIYQLIASQIESYSIGVENNRSELPYFLTNTNHDQYEPGGITSPNSISPNTDKNNTRTYTILARQEVTGAEANITVIQDKETVSESWNPLNVDTEFGEYGVRLWREGMADGDDWRNFKVGANGESSIEVQVHITQQKVITSGSGENNGNLTRSEWMSVTGIEGDSYNGGKWEAGYMMANHLHTTPKNSDIIYRIKKVHFVGPDSKPYVHDLTQHATYIDVYQEANEEKLEYVGNAVYTFQLTNGSTFNLDSPSADVVEVTFDSYDTQQRRYIYTTGESKEAAPLKTYRSCTGGFTGNSGNYASFNEYGDKTATSTYGFDVRVDANTNTSTGRTISLYIDDWNGNRHNITISQPKDTWITRLSSVSFKNLIVEFEGENINKEGITTIPASGGTVKIFANLERTYSKISQATGTSMGTNTDQTTADKVEIVTGNKYGNVTAGSEYDYIYITYPNLGSNTATHNNNYELSDIKWTLGDKYGNYNRGDNGGDFLFSMSQEQNRKTAGTTTYSIEVSSTKTDYSNDINGAMPLRPTIIVTSTKTIQYSYTSGYWNSTTQNKETVNNGWSATMTSGKSGSSVTASGAAGVTTATGDIVGNTSTTTKQKTTFRFTASGSSATYKDITFTQNVDAVSGSSYGTPQITGNATVSYMQAGQTSTTGVISAAGGNVTLMVPYSQYYSKTWYSGSTSGSETKYGNAAGIITGSASTAKDMNGKTAQLAVNGQSISMGSAGNISYDSDRTIYTISSYKVTVNGMTSSARSHTITIKQEMNQKLTNNPTYDSYAINLTYNTSGSTWSDADEFKIDANGYNSSGGQHKIGIVCTRKRYDTYTSGYRDTTGTLVNAPATITVAIGGVTTGKYLKASASGSLVSTLNLDGSGISGNLKEFYFAPGGNTTSSSKVFTMTAKCTDSTSVADTIIFTQNAVSYGMEVDPEEFGCSYTGGSTNVTVTPLTNGSMITAVPTVYSKPSWVTVDDTNWIDNYLMRITINSNGGGTQSTSARSGDVVFVHPQSSSTKANLHVSQTGYTYTGGGGSGSGSDTITADIGDAYYDWGQMAVYFNIYFEPSGATIDENTIELRIQSDPYEGSGRINNYDYYIEDVIVNAEFRNGHISCSDYSPMYLVVYYKGKKVTHAMIEV